MIDETVTFSIPVADPLTAVLICDLLWMNGVQGVEEIDIDGESVLLRSSFGTPEADTLERLADLFGDWSPSLQWETSRVDPCIADSWKQFAQTIEITPSLRIVPAWFLQSNEGRDVLDVVIDPGAKINANDLGAKAVGQRADLHGHSSISLGLHPVAGLFFRPEYKPLARTVKDRFAVVLITCPYHLSEPHPD